MNVSGSRKSWSYTDMPMENFEFPNESPMSESGTPLTHITKSPTRTPEPSDSQSPELCRGYAGDSDLIPESAGFVFVKDKLQDTSQGGKMETSLVSEMAITPDQPLAGVTATVETPDYSSVISIDDLQDDFYCFQQTPVRVPLLDDIDKVSPAKIEEDPKEINLPFDEQQESSLDDVFPAKMEEDSEDIDLPFDVQKESSFEDDLPTLKRKVAKKCRRRSADFDIILSSEDGTPTPEQIQIPSTLRWSRRIRRKSLVIYREQMQQDEDHKMSSELDDSGDSNSRDTDKGVDSQTLSKSESDTVLNISQNTSTGETSETSFSTETSDISEVSPAVEEPRSADDSKSEYMSTFAASDIDDVPLADCSLAESCVVADSLNSSEVASVSMEVVTPNVKEETGEVDEEGFVKVTRRRGGRKRRKSMGTQELANMFKEVTNVAEAVCDLQLVGPHSDSISIIIEENNNTDAEAASVVVAEVKNNRRSTGRAAKQKASVSIALLNIHAAKSPEKTPPKTKRGKKRGREQEENIEDIYLNKLWKTQMPVERPWATIYESPIVKKATGKEDYESARRLKRQIVFEEFFSKVRVKKRRQRAAKNGFKPLTKAKKKKVPTATLR